ncbi:MAG: hypothetical protein JJE55_05755 [Flavobacteriaceae bacterium]|nr:hypothetical protein [Flavobacteriaceae bacterium]
MKVLEKVMEAIDNPNQPLDIDFFRKNKISEEMISKIEHLKSKEQTPIDLNAYQMMMNNQVIESGIHSFRVISDLKKSLSDTLIESKRAQFITKWMYIGMFFVGLALMAFSIIFAFRGQQFLAIAFGSFGMIDIVMHLLSDPPQKMQDSRSNYAQLTVGVLSWFSDLIDKGAMANQNSQLEGMVISSNDIGTSSKLEAHRKSIENYLTISDAQINNTIKLLKIIDKVAEPGRTKKEKKKKTTKEKEVEKEKVEQKSS